MREISVSTTLTVYHDGRFWVGVAERVEGSHLSAARIVFGAEPSDEEILNLVRDGWERFAFSADVETEKAAQPIGNPKRRQRAAAKALLKKGIATKAQQALSAERERLAAERQHSRATRRAELREERFQHRRELRRQRHRGQ